MQGVACHIANSFKNQPCGSSWQRCLCLLRQSRLVHSYYSNRRNGRRGHAGSPTWRRPGRALLPPAICLDDGLVEVDACPRPFNEVCAAEAPPACHVEDVELVALHGVSCKLQATSRRHAQKGPKVLIDRLKMVRQAGAVAPGREPPATMKTMAAARKSMALSREAMTTARLQDGMHAGSGRSQHPVAARHLRPAGAPVSAPLNADPSPSALLCTAMGRKTARRQHRPEARRASPSRRFCAGSGGEGALRAVDEKERPFLHQERPSLSSWN